MTEPIVFSIIGEFTSPLRAALDEFQQIYHTKVEVEQMDWDAAWPKLVSYALHGGAPSISHIGSTWTSSLVAMNTLREFSASDVEALGGAGTFLDPAWQSTMSYDDKRIWSIPWSSFAFVVYYRRDHLQSAGISEEHAFATPKDLINTVKKLKENKVSSPIVLPSGNHFESRIHIAASWMWDAGGNYLSDDGQEILLNRPETHVGLGSFFELYRLMSPKDYQVDYQQSLDRFLAGDASIVIAHWGFFTSIQEKSLELMQNSGVHPLPGVPVVSGDNLVIWQETRRSLQRERAALDLVSFLVSEKTQKSLCKSFDRFPVRRDSLDVLASPMQQLVPTLKNTFETGRAHKPTRLWGRYELLLGYVFDEITNDVITKTDQSVESILQTHLPRLQQKISLLIG